MLIGESYKVIIICVVYPHGLVSFCHMVIFVFLVFFLTLSLLLAFIYRSKTYQ